MIIFDKDKGLDTYGMASILNSVSKKSKRGNLPIFDTFKGMFPKFNFNNLAPLTVKSYVGFIEYLLGVLEENVKPGCTRLKEIDEHWQKTVPTFKAIKWIFNEVPRGTFFQGTQDLTKSEYAHHTPLLLLALKRKGYNYEFWDKSDPLLVDYLGKELACATLFRKERVKPDELVALIHDTYSTSSRPANWYVDKSYPSNQSAKAFTSKLGLDLPITPTILAIALSLWVTKDNPNSYGSGIFDLVNWDYAPGVKPATSLLKEITNEQVEEKEWVAPW